MKFIKNFPALFIEKIKTLVVADLHVGIEYEFYKSGIRIPSQLTEMKENIFGLIKKTKASHLIILGDVKHDVPGVSYQEMKEIPVLMKELSQKIKIDICLGNHDTYIKELSPEEVKIHGSDGFKIEKFGFIHGHAWPAKELLSCDCLIFGHAHPVIQFADKFGYRIIEPVWIKNRINKEKVKQRYKVENTGKLEVIIMPAFNRLLGGMPVNVKRNNDELLGPLLKNNFVDMNESEIYLLDGTYLGKLKNLIS